MSRATKRRAHREAQKAAKRGEAPRIEQHIELANPQTENFAAFVVANAQQCERVAKPGTGHGKTVVICGAGPSLVDHAAEYCPLGDEVWGCNSAATWLYNNGHKITHALTVDQQPHMIEEWYDAPPLHYLLASTAHPHLADYLRDKGRDITFFHNFVGIKGPPVIMCKCGHDENTHPAGCCVQCDCDMYDE